MASGVPVISTDVGGVKEIINENVGLLVSPKDTEALKKAIEHMLENCKKYLPEKIAEYAKGNFSYAVVGRQLDVIYKEVLAIEE
jgi:glycosyltransferase involved in cell wall biosynthesis